MSSKSKRLFKKIVAWSGVFFFVLAAGMLYWQLRNHSLMDILRALGNIPLLNLFYAALACLAGYVVLSLYDYLALRYVHQSNKVVWWKWLLAGMIGFAISNNAGTAVVSGGAVRFRLYTRWRIKAADIVKMLVFSGFTYFLGAVAIMVAGYFMVPRDLFAESVGANIGISGLFLFSTASLGAYLAGTLLFQGKKIHIGDVDFKIPKFGMAVAQMATGMMDSIMASLVLYFCVMHFVDIPFTTFVGVFVIAQVAGVFSQVPGGIGVFESIIMLAMPNVQNPAVLFGSLLAYRIIYYLLPLVGAGGMFALYEYTLRARMKQWLEEARHAKWLEGARARAAAARAKWARFPRPHLPKFGKKN
ncbi:MAG: lysylphosphatidylglycerol synthase domain-containing protein [Alphaproteobacteria bacterium]|nr:lysylphosphatidylglycerol synthase domain-containing protein [Alphaproteobacteria bacterium]